MWISMGDKYVNSSPANLIVGVDVVKITAVCHVSGKGWESPPTPSFSLVPASCVSSQSLVMQA